MKRDNPDVDLEQYPLPPGGGSRTLLHSKTDQSGTRNVSFLQPETQLGCYLSHKI